MASYRPQRHQGRSSRFDDDFIAPGPSNSYDAYDDFDPRGRHNEAPPSPPRSPPRRHKSERRRQQPSPGHNGYPDEPMNSRRPEPEYRPRKREPEQRRGRSEGPDRRKRDLSPPPFGPPPDSPRRKARSVRPERESHPDRETRPDRDARPDREREYRPPKERRPAQETPAIRMKRGQRPDRDGRSDRGPPGPESYERDPHGRGGPPPYQQHPDDFRERRNKTWAPEPDSTRRYRNAMPPSPRSKSRPQGRASRHLDSDDDDHAGYYAAGAGAAGAAAAAGRRRPRSQGGDRGRRGASPDRRGPSPGRGPSRGRPPAAQKTRGAPARRNSMPAAGAKMRNIWANPLIQAGARTAFTAGAQAAMKSRGDPSPWLGSKGAKVATAALGAALVDGFMGQKHPGSTRQTLMREGIDLASVEAVKGAGRYDDHTPRHHRRR
ncbi:hypothetical protein FZEAL_10081 [Fusarium zealandicum]|uniref:Uncharacterized protein n=1 Tax=Fusarium zealandicum TaxID=1053134 RepID=A0A8H4XDI9_9HYPO|nr:hypothetical protein FZEAL_10081 [Fusarium zealandicum]